MKLYRLILFALCVDLIGGALVYSLEAGAQEAAPKPRVFVDFVSASSIVVSPGHSAPVQFNFHVHDPYHINSSHPLTEELIPRQIAVSGRKDDELSFRSQHKAERLFRRLCYQRNCLSARTSVIWNLYDPRRAEISGL
jgi:hypothetical protein